MDNQGKFQRPAQVEQLIKRYEEEGPAAVHLQIRMLEANTTASCVLWEGVAKKKEESERWWILNDLAQSQIKSTKSHVEF